MEIRDGMIWLILRSGRLCHIGMSQICLMFNGYNNYYYAWHDVMSEALCYQSSFSIRKFL